MTYFLCIGVRNQVEKIHLPYSPREVHAAKLLISLRTPAHKKNTYHNVLTNLKYLY